MPSTEGFHVPPEMLHRQIYNEEVDQTICTTEVLWQETYGFYERLKAQQQRLPPARQADMQPLLDAFAQCSTNLQAVFDKLNEYIPWFPAEPEDAPPPPPPPGRFPWA